MGGIVAIGDMIYLAGLCRLGIKMRPQENSDR